ncbi:hypothetical protein [Niabella beijingensis]|uniref:hypothetical protein n=1 Tax=Niabella beijingensis TaxID=2872700 RepID=UPI001CC1AE15|nr:hypothetical protein [Niabella beijingensis]MBZ4191538.1 hypothetical protein [Niabella beijingensis]
MRAAIVMVYIPVLLLVFAAACQHDAGPKSNAKDTWNAALAGELAEVDYEDQRYRQQLIPLLDAKEIDSVRLKAIFKKMHHSDSANLNAIINIIEKMAGPTPKQWAQRALKRYGQCFTMQTCPPMRNTWKR